MENLLLSWLSLGACVLLAIAGLGLYLDGRGRKKALRAAQATIGDLQQKVTRQDEQLAYLSRAVGMLAPGIGPGSVRVVRPQAGTKHCGGPLCGKLDCRCDCAACVALVQQGLPLAALVDRWERRSATDARPSSPRDDKARK